MESAFLIVGLGNPGQEYAKTRHNAGYLVVAGLAKQWDAEWRTEHTFRARLADARREEGRVLLAQPLTYMNLSGQTVGALTRYYQIPQNQLLVILDDADLPLGELRMRPQGGSGGHHGLASVIEQLAADGFPRLRLGIGRPAENAGREITGHVLNRFSGEEWTTMERVIERAIRQVECWLREGITRAMNTFNGMIQTSD